MKVFVSSSEHAAEIIGKKGRKIKKIARDTQTFIKCPSPRNPPIFEIYGRKRHQIVRAKRLIQTFANHFDKMKNKKRQIQLIPGEKIETIWFEKIDVACIIGKRGSQIKKIMFFSQTKTISPDTNKKPIFIVIGKEENIAICIFWMKLTVFCSIGNNYFNAKEISLIDDILQGRILMQNVKQIVSITLLRERYYDHKIIALRDIPQPLLQKNLYHCWRCKGQSEKIAKGLCGHIIACDKCIAILYVDIYLKCFYCHEKIESFLIENFNIY